MKKILKLFVESSLCIVTNPVDDCMKAIGHRHSNVYIVNDQYIVCLVVMNAKIDKSSYGIIDLLLSMWICFLIYSKRIWLKAC